jgi:hypothetical protein
MSAGSDMSEYTPKSATLPVWLDFMLFGPPAARDSAPGLMALIFGRTEHDTTSRKSNTRRLFNAVCLVIMYSLVLFLPAQFVANSVAQHWQGSSSSDKPSSCSSSLFKACEKGCERRSLLDKCKPASPK